MRIYLEDILIAHLQGDSLAAATLKQKPNKALDGGYVIVSSQVPVSRKGKQLSKTVRTNNATIGCWGPNKGVARDTAAAVRDSLETLMETDPLFLGFSMAPAERDGVELENEFGYGFNLTLTHRYN